MSYKILSVNVQHLESGVDALVILFEVPNNQLSSYTLYLPDNGVYEKVTLVEIGESSIWFENEENKPWRVKTPYHTLTGIMLNRNVFKI